MDASNQVDQKKWGRLVEFVPQVMGKTGVPGTVVGILHGDEIQAAGFGVTNIDHPLNVTDGTLFQIGSITKTFTATAIMRLVEMGVLDLDARVRTYVPDFKVADETASSQVTLRHLLTHMGGWFGDHFLDTGAGDDALCRYVADMAELEQLAAFDTVWSYNNSGFYLAGYVIEVVTGKPYEKALQELVLEPLGMENSFFGADDVLTHRFAVGHTVTEETTTVARPWALPRAVYPAGGITCSVSDLLRYARFHMGDGTAKDGRSLLTSQSLSLMQTPHATIWKDETCGLSWFLNVIDGTRSLFHGGATLGQLSLLTLIPQHNFAVAVFANADRGGIVTREVTHWALTHYLGLQIPEPEPIASPERELATYVGRYSNPLTDIEIGLLCGRLVAQLVFKRGFPAQDSPPIPSPPPMSLALCEKDRLLVLDGTSKGETPDVVRRPDGSIGWLRIGFRIAPRVT